MVISPSSVYLDMSSASGRGEFWIKPGDKQFGVGVYDALTANAASVHGVSTLWASSYSISASCGLPDDGQITFSEFFDRVAQIRRASSKPILLDMGDGFSDGTLRQRMYSRLLSKAPVAFCIEDYRPGFKVSALYETRHRQLMDPGVFCRRIRAALRVGRVVARTDGLVAGESQAAVCRRLEQYVSEEPDGLFIQLPADARLDSINEVLDVSRSAGIPLVGSPSYFRRTTFSRMWRAGFALILASNQLARSTLSQAKVLIRRIQADQVLEPTGVPMMRIGEFNSEFGGRHSPPT